MVSELKKQTVQKIVKDLHNYPIIGLVNMENLPGEQLLNMRKSLKTKSIKISMAKKKLLVRALEESKNEHIDELVKKVKGMPALILCKDNPFTLYSILQKSKSDAPAKPGQVAPKDLVVKAGPTSFAPGPIISELAGVGIKTKVDAGKLVIMADTTIVKEGEVISQKVSDTLKRLDIRPMEIGLNLVAVWENGLVFDAKQLHIDEAEFANNITQAAGWAFNLAIECAYPTAETTEFLLEKAFKEAKALALDREILADATAGEILAKAEHQALAVKEAGNIEAQVEPKPQEKSHPNFGKVDEHEAQHLLHELREKGTLRDHKE
jgi:large subunit ribosomal protein L10